MSPLRADDRVLFLAIPSLPELAAFARILIAGVVVAIGSPDEVERARRGLLEFENLLFLAAAPEQIPWRAGFFTKIYIPPHLADVARHASTELHRVLAPSGEILSTSQHA